MNKITQSITLDLVGISHNVINARQGDRLTRDLNITITDNGKPYQIQTSSYVYLRGKRADGKSVFYNATVTDFDNGIIHLDIHDYILSSPGRAKLDIGIYNRLQNESPNKEDEIASTESFELYIPPNIFNEDDIVHSDEASALSRLINSARDEISEMNELEETVSGNESDRQNSETERDHAETARITNENIRKENEDIRQINEAVRQDQESSRENNTTVAIENAKTAATNANEAADIANEKAADLQNKLDNHHFVLTKDKDTPNGVPGLDENTKVPIVELYEATTSNRGITQLEDSVTSFSTLTAATPNSVKSAYDKAISAETNANLYTDTKIADLINGAPTTLDTLGEIADAMADNQSVVQALDCAIGTKVDKIDGMGLSTNDFTTAEKEKLDGIATGAEANQNAFSNVVVDTSTISADSKTDTLTLASGNNITITADAANEKITISSTHPAITKSTDSTSTASPNPGETFTTVDSVSTDADGHVTEVNTKTVTLPSTPVTVDSTLSTTSTNPLQNKAVSNALNNKLSLSGGTLSGAINFANSKLNLVGNDCYFGDSDIAGCICLKGNSGDTGIAFLKKGSDTDFAQLVYDGEFLKSTKPIKSEQIRIKGSGNYDGKLNFGDGEYVYLHEYEDDKLRIKAKELKYQLSNIDYDVIACTIVTSGNFKYWKYADGTLKMLWKKKTTSALNVSNSNANVYFTLSGGETFPVAFTEIPSAFCSVTTPNVSAPFCTMSVDEVSSTKFGRWIIFADYQTTIPVGTILSAMFIGRWK